MGEKTRTVEEVDKEERRLLQVSEVTKAMKNADDQTRTVEEVEEQTRTDSNKNMTGIQYVREEETDMG